MSIQRTKEIIMLCYLSQFITLIAERNPVLEENSRALRRSALAPCDTENGSPFLRLGHSRHAKP